MKTNNTHLDKVDLVELLVARGRDNVENGNDVLVTEQLDDAGTGCPRHGASPRKEGMQLVAIVLWER